MSPRTQAIGVLGALLMLILIFELVRRGKLRTGYSLLWLLTGVIIFCLVFFDELAVLLSELLGIRTPRSLLFTAGIVTALLILLEHSLTLTLLWRQNKNIAQDQALLDLQIRGLEARLDTVLSEFSTLTEIPLDEAPKEEGELWKELAES